MLLPSLASHLQQVSPDDMIVEGFPVSWLFFFVKKVEMPYVLNSSISCSNAAKLDSCSLACSLCSDVVACGSTTLVPFMNQVMRFHTSNAAKKVFRSLVYSQSFLRKRLPPQGWSQWNLRSLCPSTHSGLCCSSTRWWNKLPKQWKATHWIPPSVW